MSRRARRVPQHLWCGGPDGCGQVFERHSSRAEHQCPGPPSFDPPPAPPDPSPDPDPGETPAKTLQPQVAGASVVYYTFTV
jgi:hypothetical protein